MKNNFTKIAIILDRSGSMGVISKSTIDSVNEFIMSQKQVSGEASVTLVQFDDEYETHFEGNLKLLAPLTYETYVPRGWTALYDAIGTTVDSIGKQLKSMSESSRPDKVVVVIVTDGYENRSKKFTQNMVAERIKHQREKYNWEFVFVGANQDAVLTAKTINIPAASAITYIPNATSVNNVWEATSRNLSAYRTGLSKSVSYSDFDRDNATKIPALSKSNASA